MIPTWQFGERDLFGMVKWPFSSNYGGSKGHFLNHLVVKLARDQKHGYLLAPQNVAFCKRNGTHYCQNKSSLLKYDSIWPEILLYTYIYIIYKYTEQLLPKMVLPSSTFTFKTPTNQHLTINNLTTFCGFQAVGEVNISGGRHIAISHLANVRQHQKKTQDPSVFFSARRGMYGRITINYCLFWGNFTWLNNP